MVVLKENNMSSFGKKAFYFIAFAPLFFVPFTFAEPNVGGFLVLVTPYWAALCFGIRFLVRTFGSSRGQEIPSGVQTSARANIPAKSSSNRALLFLVVGISFASFANPFLLREFSFFQLFFLIPAAYFLILGIRCFLKS